MLAALEELSLAASVHLLVAGLLLIALGMGGVGASVVVVLALLGLAGGLAAIRDRLTGLGPRRGLNTDRLVRDSWITVVLAATTAGIALGASPDELMALGGILGLVGVGNYFLRPVYVLVGSLLDARHPGGSRP
jgi:hypothetical protein